MCDINNIRIAHKSFNYPLWWEIDKQFSIFFFFLCVICVTYRMDLICMRNMDGVLCNLKSIINVYTMFKDLIRYAIIVVRILILYFFFLHSRVYKIHQFHIIHLHIKVHIIPERADVCAEFSFFFLRCLFCCLFCCCCSVVFISFHINV